MEYGKAPPAYRLQEVFLCFHIRSPGVREGTLQAERDGLYWNVSAVCSKDWDFPIRLIAETDGARTVLGVPQPEPDGLPAAGQGSPTGAARFPGRRAS